MVRWHVKDQPSTQGFRARLCYQLEVQVQGREPRERGPVVQTELIRQEAGVYLIGSTYSNTQ